MNRIRDWWLALFCLLALGGAASAQNLPGPIVLTADTTAVSLDGRSAFWIDNTARATVEELQASGDSLPWAVRLSASQYNIDGKALWFRFDVTAQDNQRWFLELASSGLDRVQLYYRGTDGRWIMQEAGDSKAVSDWPLPGRFPTFELFTPPGGTVRYWVRAEHARVNFAAPMAIVDQAALTASREREQFLLGAYFGLAALITIVSAANAIAHRDRHFGAYAAYVFSLSIGQLAYLGIGAQHVWNDALRWNEVATFVLPGVSSAVALWFVRMVGEPARFSRQLDRLVQSMAIVLLLAVAVDTFVTSRTTFAVVMVLTIVALGLITLLIGLVWAEGDDPSIRVIALGFLPVVVMALFPIARGLNLIPISPLTRYGLTIGAALEMPILFYALSLRGTRRREAQVRAAALSRTDPLTGLAHHRSLLIRLDTALARARGQAHACALLVINLTNHEAIVSEFGRDAGDRALVLSASLLRHVITDVDLAARVGDHHFALLLEGPTSEVTAQACATRIIARGLRDSEALPGGVTLKFHVAIAVLPDGQRDAAGSLQWLEGIVRDMGQDNTRKSIRAANF